MHQHILFEAAGELLAVPANLVHAIHDELTIQPVAGTKSWFLGLAVAQGKLLPITDLNALVGSPAAQGRTLELEASVGIAGLKIDRLFGLSDAVVGKSDDQGLGTKSENTLNLSLTGLVVKENDQQHHILDLASLIQSSEFTNIKEPDI